LEYELKTTDGEDETVHSLESEITSYKNILEQLKGYNQLLNRKTEFSSSFTESIAFISRAKDMLYTSKSITSSIVKAEGHKPIVSELEVKSKNERCCLIM
jgi:hypothetical protein